MNKLLSFDGKLFEILGRAADFMLLNILWILTSLPLITIGASTTALYSVMLKLVKNEESYIVKSYFLAFVENFKYATLFWTLFALVESILFWEYRLFSRPEIPGAVWIQGILFVIIVILTVSVCYLFPVLARFENTPLNTLKNVFLIAAAHLAHSIIIFAISFGPLLIMFYNPKAMIIGIFLYLFIGFAMCAWLNSLLFRNIFDRYTTVHSL